LLIITNKVFMNNLKTKTTLICYKAKTQKKIFFLMSFCTLFLCSCAGTKYKTTHKTATIETKHKSTKKETTSKTKESSNIANKIVQTASNNLGVKYKYGGTTKAGFDCSGLVFTSFKTHNISLPRSSSQMAEKGKKIKSSEAQKGDLIFFATSNTNRINHVGIITDIKNDEIKFIHSSTQKGVIISSTKESYYKKSFVKIMRVL